MRLDDLSVFNEIVRKSKYLNCGHHDQEDIASKVFIAYLEAKDKIKNFSGWVNYALRNQLIDTVFKDNHPASDAVYMAYASPTDYDELREEIVKRLEGMELEAFELLEQGWKKTEIIKELGLKLGKKTQRIWRSIENAVQEAKAH